MGHQSLRMAEIWAPYAQRFIEETVAKKRERFVLDSSKGTLMILPSGTRPPKEDTSTVLEGNIQDEFTRGKSTGESPSCYCFPREPTSRHRSRYPSSPLARLLPLRDDPSPLGLFGCLGLWARWRRTRCYTIDLIVKD